MDRPIRVLVLEDDPAMLEMLAEVLSEEGYQVDTASRGEEAVTRARETRYDLVVADIRMEGLDGLEALSQVKSHQPDVGSLVVTGYATDAQSERAARLGLGGYLRKPFELKELLDQVGTLLAERRLELKRKEREQSLQRTSAWALEALAGLVDAAEPGRLAGGFRRISQVAQHLAREMGLTGHQAEEVRLAALAAAFLRTPGKLQLPEAAQHNLPDSARDILGHLEATWADQGRDIPIAARVAAVALAAGHATPDGEIDSEGQLLASRWPGRFDPAVLEALDRVYDLDYRLEDEQPATPVDEPAPARHRRGLLSMGRTLEQAGHLEGAGKAYQDILDQRAASREGVEALLGMCRLRQSAGELSQARASALQVPELARQLGPATLGSAALRAGLLLVELGDPDGGRSLLEEARTLMGDIGLSVGAARASLALQAASGDRELDEASQGTLRLLMEPENASELADSADWLLPFLLECSGRQRDSAVERMAGRLVEDFPGKMSRVLSLGSLSPEARLAAVRALHSSSSTLSEAPLKSLLVDPDSAVREAADRALGQGRRVQTLPLLRVYSTGPFEVYRAEERIQDRKWKTQKTKYLFASLAAAGGAVVPEDVLIERFWPGDMAKCRRYLYSATSFLRRCLRPKNWDGEAEYVLRTGGGLQLNPEVDWWHDLEELRKGFNQGRQLEARGQVPGALNLYRRVVQLYRGPCLDGCYMDWALEIRNEVDHTVQEAALKIAGVARDQGSFREALEHATQALEIDPCLQEAHLIAMQAQMGLGRPEEAVRGYEQCRKILAQELDMEPSIDVERAHQRARLSLT